MGIRLFYLVLLPGALEPRWDPSVVATRLTPVEPIPATGGIQTTALGTMKTTLTSGVYPAEAVRICSTYSMLDILLAKPCTRIAMYVSSP